MIAWWSGDGTYEDRLDRAPMEAHEQVGFAPGVIGSAFDFDATPNYLSTPDQPALRPASVTIEAWVLFHAFNGIRVILSKAAGHGSSESYVMYTFGASICAGVGDPVAYGPELVYSGPLSTDTWYHLAYTFDDDANEQVLYVNGKMAAASRVERSIGYDTHPVTLGGEFENESPAYFLTGRIDEVSLYGRALRPREVLAIYKAGANGKCGGVAPRTMAEAAQALRIAGGLATATPDDVTSLQETGLGDVPWTVDIPDAIRIARKAAGTEPGP
jgi:hypothetical protein